MTRRALLIGSPGRPEAENYLEGVARDLENYRSFLRSPLGGAWKDSEIVTLRSPRQSECAVQQVVLTLVDYSFVLFTGHGEHVEGQGTRVELRPGVELAEESLATGAKRHTLVLDCCRQIVKPVAPPPLMEKLAKAERELDLAACRKAFDAAIQQSGAGVVTLYSCCEGEQSEDSAREGGLYSSSLVTAAVEWGQSIVGASNAATVFSVIGAHRSAATRVARRSGGHQNPTSMKPKSGPYFPFAVVA